MTGSVRLALLSAMVLMTVACSPSTGPIGEAPDSARGTPPVELIEWIGGQARAACAPLAWVVNG